MTPNDAMIHRLIAREGGYSDRPNDRGGPTNYGITIATLGRWRKHTVSARDVRTLAKSEAAQIYRTWYLLRPNFHKIADERLREQVFDAGVLHGTGWAVRRLQELAGVKVDGIIGPISLAAINAADDSLPADFLRRRAHKLARIVQNDPSQLVFLTGWIDRATSFAE